MSRSTRPSAKDRELQVLLHEYEVLREDERHWVVALGSFAGLALILTGFAFSLFFQSGDGARDLPGWVYLLIPAPVAVVIAFLLHLSSGLPVRSLYIRALERQLWEYTTPKQLEGTIELKYPSSGHLLHSVNSPRTGRLVFRIGQIWIYGLLAGLFVAVLVVSFGAALDAEAGVIGVVIAMLVYGALMLWLLGTTIWLVFRGHLLWLESIESMDDLEPLGTRPREPSRLLALWLPRPQDLVKSLLTLGAGLWAVLAASVDPDAGSVWEGLLAVFAFTAAFELIFYQGRYLLNDLRDSHTDELDRHRKRYGWHTDPVGSRLALLSLFVRVGLLALISWLAWSWGVGRFGAALTVAVALNAVISVVYEILRERTRRMKTKKWRQSTWSRLIYYWVGLGYGIRMAAVVWMVVGAFVVVPGVFVFATLLGSLFVTMTWALESTRRPKPKAKAHVSAVGAGLKTEGEFSAYDRVLSYPSARRGLWEYLLAALGIATPVAAAIVVGVGRQDVDVIWVVIAVVLGGLLWLPRVRDSLIRVDLVLGLSAVAVAVAFLGGPFRGMVAAALPGTAVLFIYAFFRSSTWRDLNLSPKLVVAAALGGVGCETDRFLDLLRRVADRVQRIDSEADVDAGWFGTDDEARDRFIRRFDGRFPSWVVLRGRDNGKRLLSVIELQSYAAGRGERWPDDARKRWCKDARLLVITANGAGDQVEASHGDLGCQAALAVAMKMAVAAARPCAHAVVILEENRSDIVCALRAAGFQWVARSTRGADGAAGKRELLFATDVAGE